MWEGQGFWRSSTKAWIDSSKKLSDMVRDRAWGSLRQVCKRVEKNL